MILLWFIFAAFMGLFSLYYLLKFGMQIVVLAVKMIVFPVMLIWKLAEWATRPETNNAP